MKLPRIIPSLLFLVPILCINPLIPGIWAAAPVILLWMLLRLSLCRLKLSFTAYAWLLGVAPVSQVSTYAYVNPVVAVALGAVLRDEHVTALTLLGGGITVVAVAAVVREEGRRRARERALERTGSDLEPAAT